MQDSSHSARPGGVFTVSLDLELHWGMTDLTGLSTSYSAQLRQTRDVVIPRLLALFDEYDIHATWATVGLLMFEDREQLLESIPEQRPSYTNANLSTYNHLAALGADEAEDPYHFGPSIIRRIQQCAHQEIGSHSFSHYYPLEAGHRAEALEADLGAWSKVAAEHGVEARSICFPRNQYEPSTLEICADAGINVYRGNEPTWCHRAGPFDSDGFLRKFVRRIDTYLPITKHHSPTVAEIGETAPYNVPSSRFFRAHHGPLAAFEPLKRRRILEGMTHAAENDGVYHLWWHPQDFGVDTDKNFALLSHILERFRELAESKGMVSRNMSEIGSWCDSLERSSVGGRA